MSDGLKSALGAGGIMPMHGLTDIFINANNNIYIAEFNFCLQILYSFQCCLFNATEKVTVTLLI